jgi:MoaA/NifB/PqqE/SkfB family radical SAM enzyme
MVPGLIETLASFPRTQFLLYTNCSAFDAGHAARIARVPGILPVVSIEGDAGATDRRRGAGVFACVERAMGLMRDARVVFAFCAMVTRQNMHLVTSRAWLDWMWDCGAILGILSDYTPYPGEEDPGLALTDGERAEKRRLVAARKREARPFMINFPADEYARGGCGSAGREFVHVNPQGCVEPCPLSRYAADNVNAVTLREALSSPFFAELRARSASWAHDGEGCLLLAHEADVAAIASTTGAVRTDRQRT